jgi:hypothetical protein
MRKNRDNSENEEFTIKYVEVRVKGGSDTLQTAIRSITEAVSGRPIINRTPPPSALRTNNDAILAQPTLDFEEATEGQLADELTTKTVNKPTGNKPKSKRTYPTPEVLHDLDLKSKTISFEDFCRSKNPSSDMKKYLVIATWFKEHKNMNSITTSHIYTCYRAMNWSSYPQDWKKPFRNCKTQGWFRNVTPEQWEINHLGLEVVNKLGGGI